jgi:hypothetical protein
MKSATYWGLMSPMLATNGSVVALLVRSNFTAPRPFAGLTIFVIYGPHLTNRWDDVGDLPQGDPFMVDNPIPGVRQLISGVDALVIAEISFSSPNLNVPVAPPF